MVFYIAPFFLPAYSYENTKHSGAAAFKIGLEVIIALAQRGGNWTGLTRLGARLFRTQIAIDGNERESGAGDSVTPRARRCKCSGSICSNCATRSGSRPPSAALL